MRLINAARSKLSPWSGMARAGRPGGVLRQASNRGSMGRRRIASGIGVLSPEWKKVEPVVRMRAADRLERGSVSGAPAGKVRGSGRAPQDDLPGEGLEADRIALRAGAQAEEQHDRGS